MKTIYAVLTRPRTYLRYWLLTTPTSGWLFETLKPLAGIDPDFGRR